MFERPGVAVLLLFAGDQQEMTLTASCVSCIGLRCLMYTARQQYREGLEAVAAACPLESVANQNCRAESSGKALMATASQSRTLQRAM